MRNKNVYLASGLFALFVGLIIYLLFRPNSFITEFFNYFLPLDKMRIFFTSNNCDFFKYYLVDFLWAYSLCCFLIVIFKDNKKTFFCAGFVIIYGVAWELLQWLKIIPGTADFIDVFMYCLAGVSAIMINIKRGMQNEKKGLFIFSSIGGSDFHGFCGRKRRK